MGFCMWCVGICLYLSVLPSMEMHQERNMAGWKFTVPSRVGIIDMREFVYACGLYLMAIAA